MKRQILTATGTAILIALAGCSTTPSNVDSEIDAQARHAEALKTQQAAMNHSKPGTVFNDGFYIGAGKTTQLNARTELPGWFKEHILLGAQGLYLVQVADQISNKADVPVTLDPLLREEQTATQVQMGNQAERSGDQMSISYEGTLEGLLDQVASHYGINWKYDGTQIVFYKYVTRTYTMATLPGTIQQSTTVTNASNIGGNGSGGSSGGSTASSNQTVIAAQNSDPWKDFVAEVHNELTKHGLLQANQDAGTITVTDTPEVQAQVEQTVSNYNNQMRRQCAFTVRVISLDMSTVHQGEFSLAAVFNNLKKQYNIAVAGITPPVGTGGDANITATVLTPSNAATALGSAHWTGSTALAQVLDQYGKVSLVTEGTGIAMQGQPLPMQVTQTKGYLASSSTIVGTAATAGSVSLTPGQVTTGFALVLTPRIMPDGEIIFQYALDLSSLNSIQTISSGGQEIQVPDVSSRRFVQRAEMHSGDLLILSGYEQTDNNDQKASGLLSWFHGTSSDKQMIFITIQANVI